MAASAWGAPRPNIVLIMAGEIGYSDAGCHGREIRTPNLDRLSAGGLRFSHFYNTARCCPRRSALVSGLPRHEAGVGHAPFDTGLPGYREYPTGNAVTIAEVLPAPERKRAK
ncbi:MAG: sulfatase-like hydrolase/transferase [bacterium]|nr:sulfatase-like hydrolase/transferase [bacterium]